MKKNAKLFQRRGQAREYIYSTCILDTTYLQKKYDLHVDTFSP